jgi:phosphoribosylaminoimidazole (AIR) synthetase
MMRRLQRWRSGTQPIVAKPVEVWSIGERLNAHHKAEAAMTTGGVVNQRRLTDTDLLAETVTMTDVMRRNADWIAELGQARRQRWQELFECGVAQGTIAKACDVSRQTVYMEIRRSRASAVEA